MFSILNPAKCSECGAEIDKGGLLRMEDGKPLCMSCSDLDHLVYLPSGDVAVTRRSRKYSTLSAVVLRFSRSRGRYERQGLLIEEDALDRAEAESLSDEDKRRRAREKAAVIRDRADQKYVAEFAAKVSARYPKCPVDEAKTIAEHACVKYSGRVGRSAAAKDFDETMIDLAVRAHIRHTHTEYDDLLSRGEDRRDSRSRVLSHVEKVAAAWRNS